MERVFDDVERGTPAPQPASSFAAHGGASDAASAVLAREAVPDAPLPVTAASSAATTVRPIASYEIRALTTVAELVESYRLRHDMYRALGYLPCCLRSRLEIDAYDRSAIAFGAFDAASGAMIGTLRLITGAPQRDRERTIGRIVTALADRELALRALAPPRRALPSIVSDEIARQIVAFNTGRFPVLEFSRFIVHPAHRFSNVSCGLAMLGIAHAMRSAPAVFIAGCLPRHNRFYAGYGFVKLPNTGLDHFDSVGQLANTIICRSDALPPAIRSRIDELLRSMASGASEHAHELCRDSRAVFRFAAPRRVRREVTER